MEDNIKFILAMGKSLGLNVNTPNELVTKKEDELLSKEELGPWLDVQIALGTLDAESIKKILRLAVMKYIKSVEFIVFDRDIKEDNINIIKFIQEHSEYHEKVNPDELFSAFL